MKKVLLIAGIICATITSNAAVIKWGAGAVQTPGAEGVLSGTKLTSSSGFVLKMYAFESLSTISYSKSDIYKWYENGATGTFKDLKSIEGRVTMSSSATVATATGLISPTTDGTTVYAAVLFVLEDAGTGKAMWYMENAGEKSSAKSIATLTNLSLKIGGTGEATVWTPVPEPTSGLLMLLGIVSIALRRRNV